MKKNKLIDFLSKFNPKNSINSVYLGIGLISINFIFGIPMIKKIYHYKYGNSEEITHVCFFELELDNKFIGQIEIGLFGNSAPKNINNFLSLCQGEYGKSFRENIVHMLVPGYIIALGDVTNNDGTGHYSVYNNEYVEDEFSSKLNFNTDMVVGLCNTGKPNTNGSQFFITLDDIPSLNGKHTIIGKVTSGSKLLKALSYRYGTINGDPNNELRILSSGILKLSEYKQNKKI